MRVNAANGGDAQVDRVVDRTLEADWRGFRHAVGDRDFLHMHLLDDPGHHFGRAGRARHDAGAQARQVVLYEVGMIEDRDEHRRNPMQPGAAFGLHRVQHGYGIETFARIDHRRAMCHASQVAEHHAEAVIQRYRNAQLVFFGQPHRLTDEEPIVQNIVVRQRRSLRRAGGARGELDIDGVVELQRGGDTGEARPVIGAERCEQVIEIEHARGLAGAEADHLLQMRQPAGAQGAGLAMVNFGHDVLQYRDIVARLEGGCQDQRTALHLVEYILEFGAAVRRVDIDHD